jgi:SynChlorMet cassette radical SAM/SPASM protein ScmE
MAVLSDLPTERWLTFFQEMGSIGVQKATVSGGEAFTRSDIFELIDGLIENKMRYNLLTNGTLMTEETIAAFKKGKRRLRLDSIQISIDGASAAVHDASRPPHSFDRAIQGLCLLKENGFPVTVRVTVNRYNLDDLENIAHLLLEDIGVPRFSTNEADRFGSARCYGQDVILGQKERYKAMVKLEALAKRYPGRISAAAGPLAISRHFAQINELVAGGATEMKGRGNLSSCGGAFSKVAVLHDGTIVPCNLLPDLKMGKIGETPLQEAWFHSPAINAIRRRRDVALSTLPECQGCSYAGFCAGGCPAVVYAQSGKLEARDPLICYRQFKEGADVAV